MGCLRAGRQLSCSCLRWDLQVTSLADAWSHFDMLFDEQTNAVTHERRQPLVSLANPRLLQQSDRSGEIAWLAFVCSPLSTLSSHPSTPSKTSFIQTKHHLSTHTCSTNTGETKTAWTNQLVNPHPVYSDKHQLSDPYGHDVEWADGPSQ